MEGKKMKKESKKNEMIRLKIYHDTFLKCKHEKAPKERKRNSIFGWSRGFVITTKSELNKSNF